MFSSLWFVGIVLFSVAARFDEKQQKNDPRLNITSCEEFEIGARFSPYRIVDSMWKIFYYWSNNTELYPVYFSIPTKKSLNRLKEVFEAVTPNLEVEWEKAALFMEPRPGVEILLLYGGTPGAFRALIKQERRSKVRPHPGPLTGFADVRIKLVDRFLGIMCCEDLTAFALVRVDELPTTEEGCLEAAYKIGFRAPGGRSYMQVTKQYEEERGKEL